ncbi:MAG: hypothetical protein E7290_01980 [Lachnospiraceae bacterium]|nr:hypothetical protein [Lachnospiraceae bacterium]
MEFIVEKKIIECDVKEIVGDNDYEAIFVLDDEWDGKAVQVKVVWNNRASEDIDIVDDKCTIPAHMLKKGNVSIGVFADGLASSRVNITVRESIKQDTYAIAVPHKEIWEEIKERVADVVTNSEFDSKVNDYLAKDNTLAKKTDLDSKADCDVIENLFPITSWHTNAVRGVTPVLSVEDRTITLDGTFTGAYPNYICTVPVEVNHTYLFAVNLQEIEESSQCWLLTGRYDGTTTDAPNNTVYGFDKKLLTTDTSLELKRMAVLVTPTDENYANIDFLISGALTESGNIGAINISDIVIVDVTDMTESEIIEIINKGYFDAIKSNIADGLTDKAKEQLKEEYGILTSPLQGKKVAWIGTSITQLGTWCTRVSEYFGFDATNCGVGGTAMCYEDEASMCTQERLLGQYSEVTDENTGEVTSTGVAVPSDVEIIFIEAGANDWSRNKELGTKEITFNDEGAIELDTSTYYGACHQFFKNVTELFPNAVVIAVGAPFGKLANREVFTNSYGLLNNHNLQTVQYGDALVEIAGLWGFKGFNVGRISGINDNNIAEIIPDGLHLTTDKAIEMTVNAVINELNKITRL